MTTIVNITDDTIMPVGKTHKGKRVDTLPTRYLLWLVSHDVMRAQYPKVAFEAMCEIRLRAAQPGRFEDELFPPEDGSGLV